jgi:hypothetical protein
MKGIKNLVTDFYMKLLGETSHAFTQSKAERVSKLIQNNFPSSCISEWRQRLLERKLGKQSLL